MAAMKLVLIERDGQEVPGWAAERLESAGIALLVQDCPTRAELAEHAGDADMIWLFGGRLSAEDLEVLPRCGAIIRAGSGVDNVPVSAATERGIVVAHTPEATSEGLSEHVIGLWLALIREIVIQDRLIRAGTWDRERALPARHLRGQTVGLIGFGHASRLVAEKLRGFEVRLLAHDPYLDRETIERHGASAVSLDALLSEADFVTIHCPLTRQTRHLIGERELRLMKPTALLVNTARGGIIDEAALVRALDAGWIAGAGLDVLEQEPPAADNPLIGRDNVILTPHVGGLSDSFRDACWRGSVEAAEALAQGRWPRAYVNRDVKPSWKLA